MKGLSIVKIKKKERGIGVIEMIISLMVITSAFTAVILIVFGNQSLKLDNEVNNDALYRASQIIEKSKVLAAGQFSSVVASSSTENIFSKNLAVLDISPCRKDITSSINWSVQVNRSQNVFLTTSLVSQEEAEALGEDCELTPPSQNWEIDCPPQHGFDFTPGGLAATGLDLLRRGNNKYAILTSGKGSVDKHDFWIVDVTTKTSINLVSSINTGPDANDVDAFGNYAFVANNNTTGQLIVIDISNLSSPATISYKNLPGVNPAGSWPQAREVFYYNDRVYVGTRETAGPEFHIFDVSNPSNPVHLGSREINHTIHNIIVRGDYAYLATSADQNELIILNVSNPASIQPAFPGVGNPEPMGFNAPGSQDGKSIYLLGDKLYLGRDRGTGANYDFLVLDIKNPNSVSQLGAVLLNLNPNTAAQGSIVSAGLAFIVTSDQNKGFQLWNVANPASMSEIDSCNYSEKVVDIDFDGQHHYVANESNNGLRIISSVNP